MKNNHMAYSAIFTIFVLLRYGVNCKDKVNFTVAVVLPFFEDLNEQDYRCSKKFRNDALPTVEALYYALDLIERDEDLTRNFILNIEVFETCGNKITNMEPLAKIYQKASLEKVLPVPDDNNSSILIGVIYSNDYGPFEYAKFFREMNLKDISISGPPKNSFNFDELGTDSPIVYSSSGHFFILDVIFEILAHLRWKHVKVEYSAYLFKEYQDRSFIKRAQELANSYEVCISSIRSVQESDLFQSELSSSNLADVIICYCDASDIMALKNQLGQRNRTNSPGKVVVIAGNTDESWTKGKITWDPQLGDLYYVTLTAEQYVKEFHDYYTSLSMKNFTKHSYLKTFRQRYFKSLSANIRGNETDESDMYRDTYKNSSRQMTIIRSVYTIAHCLKKYYGSFFKEVEFLFNLYYVTHSKPPNFTLFGKEVRYIDGFLSTETFDVYKYYAKNQLVPYNFIKVAEYLKYNETIVKENQSKSKMLRIVGNLTIFDEKFFQTSEYRVNSVCSDPCQPGHRKELKVDRCCWDCVPCDDFEKSNGDTTFCEKCNDGFVPNTNKTECIPIHVQLPKIWNEGSNLISICFSAFSIVFTLIVLRVFFKYRNTPAVKSATRELCYVMFAGIILANVTIFISALTLSFETTNVKTLPAIGFAMVYGALLVKTNRIARLLVTSKHKFANIHPKYVSLNAQMTITCTLVVVEILICWLAVQTQYVIPMFDANDLFLKKYHLHSTFLIEIFGFIGLLMVLCTYYAIKTRNLPENFNETKYIGFAMYATVLTVAAFSLVYFSSNKKILATHLCISINSLTILTFLFLHKLYIILWTPEKNTRIYFSPMTSSIRSYQGNELRSADENAAPTANNTEGKKEQARDLIAQIMTELASVTSTKSHIDEKVTKNMVERDDLELVEAEDTSQKAQHKELVEKVKLCQKKLEFFQKKYL